MWSVDKSNGRNHQLAPALRMQLANMVADIGLEPGLSGRSAAALIDEFPIGVP